MELALAPTTLAASAAVPTRPNRATQRSVPAFLNKLYSMVSDTSTDDLIRWSEDGESFFVPSADRFGKELLPRFFKHSNFGSFVRQLNMYGFHKVPHLQQGVLKRDQSEDADVLVEFSNPHFVRGQPDLLCMIKRQKAGKGETAAAAAVAAAAAGASSGITGPDGRASPSTTSLNIATLLSDLAAIRKHQTAISADLKDLQARNHALWQEALQSREKHKKQEETINKILRFLAGVFGGQVLDAGQTGSQPQVGADDSESPSASGTAAGTSANGIAGPSSTRTATGKTGRSGTGGGGVVLMPKSRLLLEDVKGRQQQRRAALREWDDEVKIAEQPDEDYDEDDGAGAEGAGDDDDDEIEEIPLLHAAEDEEDMPIISSALITSGPSSAPGALTRAPSNSSFPATSSSSRFSAIPSPADTSQAKDSPGPSSGGLIDPSQYNMPPEAVKALLSAAGNNPQALQDFLRTSGANVTSATTMPVASSSMLSSSSGGGSSSASGVPATSSALLPYHHQPLYNPTPSPLDFSFSTSLAPATTALTTAAAAMPSPISFESALAENNDVLSSVLSEKADIDQRTAALENQITKLLDNLPDDAREQVENEAANGENSNWAGIDWDNYTNDDGGVDFDKMLAQLSEISSNNEAPIDYSELLSNNALDPSLTSTAPSSAPTPSAGLIDPSLYNLGRESIGAQPAYEVTSPAGTDLASPASSVNSPASITSSKRPSAGAGGRGRKRKSDAMGTDASAGSPAATTPGDEGTGTRRSTRRKRS